MSKSEFSLECRHIWTLPLNHTPRAHLRPKEVLSPILEHCLAWQVPWGDHRAQRLGQVPLQQEFAVRVPSPALQWEVRLLIAFYWQQRLLHKWNKGPVRVATLYFGGCAPSYHVCHCGRCRFTPRLYQRCSTGTGQACHRLWDIYERMLKC